MLKAKSNKQTKLIIIGAGGHGKVIADIAARNRYGKIAFLDDEEKIKSCMGYPVIGKTKEADQYPEYDFFVAIGNGKTREIIQSQLINHKMHLATLIHPNTIIASDVSIGNGSAVMAGAIINSGTKIGRGCIINTGAIIEHDNDIQDYAHIAVGGRLSGSVKIGTRTWIGVGAVVIQNITICSECMIGAGAVIIKDITKSGTYVGVPARELDVTHGGGGAFIKYIYHDDTISEVV